MMVTCRRSTASNDWDGGGSDVTNVVKLLLLKRAPQLAQKFAPAALWWRHSRQRTGKNEPRLLRNRFRFESWSITRA
jgi:hypothetical protein